MTDAVLRTLELTLEIPPSRHRARLGPSPGPRELCSLEVQRERPTQTELIRTWEEPTREDAFPFISGAYHRAGSLIHQLNFV